VTERCENLPDEALKYYKVATKKQLKSRLSVKLGKFQQTPLSRTRECCLFQLQLGSWAFFGDEFSVIHVILFNCV
jgi:hypothetical protein